MHSKRAAGLITAFVIFAILALHIVADTGAIDATADADVVSPSVQTETANKPVGSSNETYSTNANTWVASKPLFAINTSVTTNSAITADPIESTLSDNNSIHTAVIGETDSYTGDPVESQYVQSGGLPLSIPMDGETDSYGDETSQIR